MTAPKKIIHETVEDVPGIGISYSATVGDGKSIVFQSAIARDCSQAELDELLDKFQKASERAMTYGRIEHTEAELEREEGQIFLLKTNLDMVADKYAEAQRAFAKTAHNGKQLQLPKAELANKENLDKNLAAHQQGKRRNEEKLRELRAKLGGA